MHIANVKAGSSQIRLCFGDSGDGNFSPSSVDYLNHVVAKPKKNYSASLKGKSK